MTVADALRLAERRLAAAGVAAPAWDAELLLRHVLRWDRAALLAGDALALNPEQEVLFLSLVAERERRRPLQHLTGTQSFWGRDFIVSPDVLIPRRETELLVEAALELLAGVAAPVVVDVGTGTGCIALTIAAERLSAEVHAVDISPAALEVARANARRLGLEGRVLFHEGDLTLPAHELSGRVDLVASNPPYVRVDEVPELAPEVRDHEPRMALVPTPNAAGLYRRLAAEAHRLLRPEGGLIVEIGLGMRDEVAAICESEGLRIERVIPDLQGIPRILVARRPTRSIPPDLA